MKATVNDINILYPDLGFAFNPVRIFIDNYVYGDPIILEANGVKIEREPYSGTTNVSFELSAIAKSLFDRSEFYKVEENDSTLFKTLSFSLSNHLQGEFYQGSIPIIWGALQIGERYSQNKTLTYFKGYPFTLPLYLEESAFLQASIDKGNLQDIGLFEKGKFNVNLPLINAKESAFITSATPKYYKIFDHTFDSTFGPQRVDFATDLNINIKIADCVPDGVYLRWINKYGEYNYYLFESSNKSTTTKKNEIKFDNVYYTTDLTDNYHHGIGKSIGKHIEQSIKLFAHLVDSQTVDFLQHLVESPVVDMFLGYDKNNSEKWISVDIQDGTFSKSNNVLQDFELSLIPNNKIVQTL